MNQNTLEVTGPETENSGQVLTVDALYFLARLHDEFMKRRNQILENRIARQKDFDAGKKPDFRDDLLSIRESDKWCVTPPPEDIKDRRVEITGPVERKMMINALNSGAKCFMADFEDSLSPTWHNVIDGQVNTYDAFRKTLTFDDASGKSYALNDDIAQLLLRPRGWHLPEKHVQYMSAPCCASLFDFGLLAFHNLQYRVAQGSGLYLYLPKLENAEEAQLWAAIFRYTEDHFGVPRGSVRATVLIETITAVFEIEEILYALKEHSLGCNAGRWDYIFSAIKKFFKNTAAVLPDRNDVTMTVPFMKAYTEHLVKICHKRNAFAMGGMAAFVPSRKDEDVNKNAMQKVAEDKTREAEAGFDGTWVAHPDLVPVAMRVFDTVLGDNPNQIDKKRDDVQVTAADLLSFDKTPGRITVQGIRNNISVAIQYIAWWMEGRGAVAINNLMEDAATAEIARAQLLQWVFHKAKMENGSVFTQDLYTTFRNEELDALKGNHGFNDALEKAAGLLDELVIADHMAEFLTLPAYHYLD